jgi:5-methylcytosine-specific restriction endonuclease McrA
MLSDLRKVRRQCATKEEAEVAVIELIDLHREKLGYQYWAHFGGKRRPWLIQPRPRSGITTRRRWDVFARDGFRCRYCGASPADGIKLTVDHVQPVIDGGSDDLENLVTACAPCNAGKAARPLLVPVP